MCYHNSYKKPSGAITVDGRDVYFDPTIFDNLGRVYQNGLSYGDWPIVKADADKNLRLSLAHWEFIPYWYNTIEDVKAARQKFTTLNAVGEELFVKRTYKDAAAKRRCLVLSSGFFEWRHYKPEGSKKEIAYPYFVTVADKGSFYLAGIWQPWTDKSTGETFDTFSIVTTKANPLMAQVHNKKQRMPTILPDALASEWLEDGLDQQRITEIATFQYPQEQMKAYTVYKDFQRLEEPDAPFTFSELPVLC
jgi:putative SOS response-associated peptidase YedK